MGLILSRLRKKRSTKELLEQIQKDVEEIEGYREHTQQRQKRLVGCLVLYSIVSYLVAALVCYFYYFPETPQEQLIYVSPFIVFPFVIYILKRLLTWYYRRKLHKNEQKLKSLRDRQEKILEQVMETETYKVAKEILEKYAPDQLRRSQMHKTSVVLPPLGQLLQTPANQHSDVRRRLVVPASAPPQPSAQGGGVGTRPVGPQGLQNPAFTPRLPPSSLTARPGIGVSSGRSASSLVTPGHVPGAGLPSGSVTSSSYTITSAPSIHSPVARVEGGPPGPPMPRPVLPRERGYMDRFIEYLVGDGPANRFALVCRQCESHNGMALKEEFPYLAFRCAYCFYWNPARKQRPSAPRLENLAPQLPPSLPVSEVQEEEEEEQEEQESSSGEEEEEEEEEEDEDEEEGEEEEEEDEEDGGVEEEESGSSSSGEEEDEEEGVISMEISSTKAACSQEGSLEDEAKSTPPSDPSSSDDHQLGSPLADSSTLVASSSATPSSATEAEETE